MFIPDEDVNLNEWRAKHADHFASPEHVSKSKFRQFWGSVDLGTRLHIEPAGERRDAENKKLAMAEQRKRSSRIKGAVDQ